MRSPRLSRLLAAALAVSALALWARPAAAQYPPPPPPPGYYPPPPQPPGPPRITGALKLGLDVPYGRAFGDVKMSELFDPQFGIMGELGVRVTPHLTLGGYLGFGFGSTGSYYRNSCGGHDCDAFAFRTGFMAQYTFAPLAPVTPWIGYGFGFTTAYASGDSYSDYYYDYAPSFEHWFWGFDVARFSAGIDLRPVRGFGIGLYVDYAIGIYTGYDWSEYGYSVSDGWMDNSQLHQWLSFGPRISF